MKSSSSTPVTNPFGKMHFYWLMPVLFVLCSFAPAKGQRTTGETNRREAVQQERLKKLLSKVDVQVPEINARAAQPQTYRELKIRWADSTKSKTELRPAANAGDQISSVSVVEDKKRSGTLPRSRSLELSPAHVFVAAVDAGNKLRWWSIMPDPRVVRSETQTSSGELRGQDYYVSNVTLVVAFPDDPEIANLRFYHPVWNGTDFDLKLLTTVPTR
ncbi:MAG TPA: hypothetical protein VFS77_03955 [Pyrinomonadaceae bacterium]|nr:hypothetical protein [Pyrinomonadaceae bacterium]